MQIWEGLFVIFQVQLSQQHVANQGIHGLEMEDSRMEDSSNQGIDGSMAPVAFVRWMLNPDSGSCIAYYLIYTI